MRNKTFSYLVKLLILFTLYLISGERGLSLDPVSGFATLVWLPTGISLTALLLFGNNLWPAITLGAFFVNLLQGAMPLVAVSIAAGNTLEAVAGSFLLKKTGFHPALKRIQDILLLVAIGAFFSTTISATIGVSSLYLGKVILLSAYLKTWLAWWVGDMISDLVIAPLILVYGTSFKLNTQKARFIEGIFLALLLLGVGFIVFRNVTLIKYHSIAVVYIVFPPLIWIAVRFGLQGAVTAIFILSIFAVWGTASGSGPFTQSTLSESLLFTQLFMGVIATTTLILATSLTEREELEKRKDEFISIASHELKTPLTSIKTFTQILQKKLKTISIKKTLEYLNRIDIELNRSTRLVNDLLDISKIQAGRLEFKKKRFSLPDLIEETVENFQTNIKTHKIMVKGDIKKKVYADEARISQVLTNLLANAIKYSPDRKKVIIDIIPDSRKVIVAVKDFGIGIPEKYHKQIFRRFFSVNESNTHTGFGIGLYLSRQIIKYHGGEMWFASRQKKGSTFYFSLPLI